MKNQVTPLPRLLCARPALINASVPHPTPYSRFTRLALSGSKLRPNGSRLSCGAPKNDSFPNLRAPTASSAC